MIPRPLPILGLSLMLFCINGLAAAPQITSAPANYLHDISQQGLEELKKPQYAVSRCAISPVLASDGMTVALSVDRVFSAGDVVLAVGNERVDTSAKTPVRDILMKHGPSESVEINIRRADKELVVTAKCTDAKPVYDLLLEANFAASKNDAAACADKLDAASKLQALTGSSMFLAYHCSRLAGRITNASDLARGYYNIYRMLILINVWSPDALGRIRGNILSAVDVLNKGNQTLLADDLKQQYDQALAAKSQLTTATVSK
jgi:hypothetical protein